jgi:U3 small nucleolar RNA-associated protein 5
MTGSDVLGPNDMGGAKRPRVAEDSHLEELTHKKSKKDKKDKEHKKDKKDKKEKKNGKHNKSEEEEDAVDEEDEEQELTLGQRLEQLSKSMNDLEDSRDSELVKLQAQHNRQIPTADSLVTLLEQALQSGDAALLEQCLLCTNTEIIDATTQRLPTHRILVLLKTLVNKFEKRPSRGLLVTQWLSFILRHHIAFLITVPDLSKQLAGLSQLLEQRLSSYSRLTTLSGRLDLLMSQVTSQKNVNDSEGNSMVPLVEYQDE